MTNICMLNINRLFLVKTRTFLTCTKLIRRNIFNSINTKSHSERKLVGYSQEQMFEVVADVKNYYKFVPFCKKSAIIVKRPGYLKAELQIGFPPIVESYTSHVLLEEPFFVSARSVDGTLFKFLETNWKFSNGLRSNPQSCIIDFSIKFEFRSMFYSQVALMFFEKLVHQMEKAFITEAKRRFGKESLPSHKLNAPLVKS